MRRCLLSANRPSTTTTSRSLSTSARPQLGRGLSPVRVGSLEKTGGHQGRLPLTPTPTGGSGRGMRRLGQGRLPNGRRDCRAGLAARAT